MIGPNLVKRLPAAADLFDDYHGGVTTNLDDAPTKSGVAFLWGLTNNVLKKASLTSIFIGGDGGI